MVNDAASHRSDSRLATTLGSIQVLYNHLSPNSGPPTPPPRISKIWITLDLHPQKCPHDILMVIHMNMRKIVFLQALLVEQGLTVCRFSVCVSVCVR